MQVDGDATLLTFIKWKRISKRFWEMGQVYEKHEFQKSEKPSNTQGYHSVFINWAAKDQCV